MALDLAVFWVGHGLNLRNGGRRGILAWAKRIVKNEECKLNYEFMTMNRNRVKAGLSPVDNKKPWRLGLRADYFI
jgi:hypothetical protein